MEAINVCNIALGQLGVARLTQLDEVAPKSRAEELCVTHYASAVAMALEAREWSFATEWRSVPKATLAGAHPVLDASRFLIPSDVLRVLKADDGSGECVLPFARRGNYIYADLATPIYLRVIKLVEDPDLWSPTFVVTVGFKLAALLAVATTESVALEERMEGRYEQYLRAAAALDGMQGTAERRTNTGPLPSSQRY